MFVSVMLLLISFIILIKGADYFVEGASNLAVHFNLSKILVGLTIVAFGTSAPEFAVSVQSMINGTGEIVLGNVVGSNITNILLIIGVTSLWGSIKVKNSTVKKEIPMLFLLTVLLSVLYFDNIFDPTKVNELSRSDGIIIMLFFAVFIYYLISYMRKKHDTKQEKPDLSLLYSIFYIFGGIIAVIISSDIVVTEATNIAQYLNVSQRIISLTIVAFGTSLPELATGITAASKKETDILIGNVIGSNIFNICIVLGIPIAIFGGIEYASFNYIDFFTLIISSALVFLFALHEKKITKKEGVIFLLLYFIYYALIFL